MNKYESIVTKVFQPGEYHNQTHVTTGYYYNNHNNVKTSSFFKELILLDLEYLLICHEATVSFVVQ